MARAKAGDTLGRLFTPADRLLIVLLLALSAGSFAAVQRLRPLGETVVVEADNREVYRGSLREARHLEVRGPVGTTVVEIQGGAAWVSSSDCHLHICVHTGKISQAGSVIACVPNRVVVRIEGRRHNQFDAIIG
ncbi:MAG: NusG domain II-containing protein [Calditrichaeota bacterium]|nr:NusG domain II-containing protein [Calditrichota bacterium]